MGTLNLFLISGVGFFFPHRSAFVLCQLNVTFLGARPSGRTLVAAAEQDCGHRTAARAAMAGGTH